MQVSLVFATALVSPTDKRSADIALQPGATELSVRRMATMSPRTIPPIANPRIAILRGGLAFPTVQRIKFG